MRRRAYTLVEVLAVTVLLGLVVGLAVPALVRAADHDPAGRAGERLAHAFRSARALGYGHPLHFELDGSGFTALAVGPGARRPLATFRLPASVQAVWTSGGRAVEAVQLDARGHGPDLELALRLESTAQERVLLADGLTGLWAVRP